MSDNPEFEKFIVQTLAMANNFFCTGRPNRGMEALLAVQKINADHPLLKSCMDKLQLTTFNQPAPNLDNQFGKIWLGENLDGKSIEIFCDQGMGDTINLLRYVQKLKEKYDCKIVLNCYAFFNQFERLMATQDYIDQFTPFHVVCDFSTNIMSIPSLLNGLSKDFYYPVHFEENMRFEIPPQAILGAFEGEELNGRFKVGVVWQSNGDNPLSKEKSIAVSEFYAFALPTVNLYCLQPNITSPIWICPLQIGDLYDTAAYIQQCDCVISVDTAVLHLAGALHKKAFGLLPYNSDPRWGTDTSTCWYPSMELFRQSEDKDWSKAIMEVRARLVSLSEIV
jgi:hypothetical protein